MTILLTIYALGYFFCLYELTNLPPRDKDGNKIKRPTSKEAAILSFLWPLGPLSCTGNLIGFLWKGKK